ncbi:MAG: carboxypeptidase regulatory-like domain-containing protein [candidate division Zixibacteria bacterium]|jgi:hypothetical protein|nr:carboxypeptidase regulatory-like domain-containing protein [candidate division Zixibacteria bacterium]
MCGKVLLVVVVAAFSAVPATMAGDAGGRLNGVLTQKDNGLPVANVALRLVGTDFRAVSDQSGYYEFTNLKPGSYCVVIRHWEFDTVDMIDIPITAGSTTTRDISMVKQKGSLPFLLKIDEDTTSGGIQSVDELLAQVTGVQTYVEAPVWIRVACAPEIPCTVAGIPPTPEPPPACEDAAVDTVRSITEATPQLPVVVELAQNYPNPCNPTTTIRFGLPSPGEVRIDIINILGQVVKRLVRADMPAGYHDVEWNGRNDGGGAVASGVYFYRLIAGKTTLSKKMILLK